MQKACQKALVNHLLRVFSIFLIKVAVRQQILNLPKLLRNSWKVNGLRVLQIGIGKGGRTGCSVMNGLIFLSFRKSEEVKITQKRTQNKGKGKAKEEKHYALPASLSIRYRLLFLRQFLLLLFPQMLLLICVHLFLLTTFLLHFRNEISNTTRAILVKNKRQKLFSSWRSWENLL